jgi:hypothetical protein
MKARLVVLLLVCVVVAPAAVATTGVAADDPATASQPTPETNVTVSDVTFSGPGVYRPPDSTETYLWRGATTNVTVTVRTGNVSERFYDACVYLPSAPEGAREIACGGASVPGNSTRQVTVPVEGWPNATGPDATAEQQVGVRLEAGFYDDFLGNASAPARLILRDTSLDGDELTNAEEARLGTNLTSKDTDGDGLWDDVEAREYGTDPLQKDTDGDGLPDAKEVSENTDPLEADSDGDGLPDGPEVDDYDTNPTEWDSDGDGLADGVEVDDYGTDPTAADSDGDGLADGVEADDYGTDPTAADSDGDGLADDDEVWLGTDPTSLLSPWLVVLSVLVAFGGLGLYATSSSSADERRRDLDVVEPAAPRTDDGTAADGAAAAAGDQPSAPASATSDFDDDTVPLLTDTDRIERLLADGGGHLRQQAIVRETDWSKSKVSRLLSQMEEEGRVTKISVGRENVISLPGREPPGSKSLLDEE